MNIPLKLKKRGINDSQGNLIPVNFFEYESSNVILLKIGENTRVVVGGAAKACYGFAAHEFHQHKFTQFIFCITCSDVLKPYSFYSDPLEKS